ncbi:hypothetical protein FRB93_010864 [Tulasnella sp. JGI-2019a]|nr:hypothetical protein FRB93_010864 [Tulasnella sp. JGI-2019a]
MALDPVIQEFQDLIEGDIEIFVAFGQMFDQVPKGPPYDKDPRGQPAIGDYKAMLQSFNKILTTAPIFEPNDFVGFPINAILNWVMGTPAGYTAFTNPKVIKQFKKMFHVWSAFLSSPESRHVLNDNATDGWFGDAASKVIPNFAETFVCDPDVPFYGYQSWDDFFTRKFRPGVRPFEFPDNNAIINSACESTVYRIVPNVAFNKKFWLKGQPYSLENMLNDDPLAPQFSGGTVYQAYLAAINYHRWNSPVNGTVVKIVQVPGAYYAACTTVGFDPSSQCLSQAFLTAVATRALIFIQADHPRIGLMCFMAVGMADVSTCEVVVGQGQRLKKGDEIGMFHYGGSTHCLIFRPDTKIMFSPDYERRLRIRSHAWCYRVLISRIDAYCNKCVW